MRRRRTQGKKKQYSKPQGGLPQKIKRRRHQRQERRRESTGQFLKAESGVGLEYANWRKPLNQRKQKPWFLLGDSRKKQVGITRKEKGLRLWEPDVETSQKKGKKKKS